MAHRKFRLIIIGDEILSGRRQDKHLSKVISLLAARGLKLSAAEIISDAMTDIVDCLERSFATPDIVFCCGGIGATPDDRTRQAAAQALGLPLELHPEAAALIAERCADTASQGQGSADMSTPENQQRLQMGVFPRGAEIVPNSFNKIPGFFIQEHTFMPGFPVMAWPMIEWTLDYRYPGLHNGNPDAERSFIVYGLPESRITPALVKLEEQWSGLQAFSLPSVGGSRRPHIELGVRGSPEQVDAALGWLKGQATQLGGEVDCGADAADQGAKPLHK